MSLCLICLACILQLSSPSAVACFYLSLTHQQNIQVAITLGPKLGSKIPCSTCIPAAYPCRTPLPFLPAKQRSCQILNNENCAFPALPVAHLCRMPLPILPAKQRASVVQGDHGRHACWGMLMVKISAEVCLLEESLLRYALFRTYAAVCLLSRSLLRYAC